MKIRDSALLLSALVWSNVFAQPPVEMADARAPIVRYDHVVKGEGDAWIFAGYVQAWSERRTLLVARSSDGEILWQTPDDVIDALFEPVFMTGTASSMLYGGRPFSCSMIANEFVIQKRDLQGAVLWTQPLDDIEPVAAAISSTEIIAFIGDAVDENSPPQMLLMNGSGADHVAWGLPASTPRSVKWDSAGDLFTLQEGLLMHWSIAGELSQEITLPEGAIDLLLIGPDDLRVLYPDHLIQFNGALEFVGIVPFTSDAPAQYMEWSQDTIWVATAHDIFAIDPEAGLSASFNAQPVDSLVITGLAVSGGTIMTAGTATIDGRSSGVMRSFTTAGDHVAHDVDVALSVASVDQLFLTSPAPQFPEMVQLHVQVTLAVENQGLVLVQKLLLNTQRTIGDCGADFGANIFADSLQLAPGATTYLQLPLITYWPVNVALGESLMIERCYVALAPNDRVDRQPADNSTCYTFDVLHTLIGGRDDFGGVVVAPNPFADRFTIQLDHTPMYTATISVHDAAGRSLVQHTWPAGQSVMHMDAAELPYGVLILKLDAPDQRLTRQLVKVP